MQAKIVLFGTLTHTRSRTSVRIDECEPEHDSGRTFLLDALVTLKARESTASAYDTSLIIGDTSSTMGDTLPSDTRNIVMSFFGHFSSI